MFAFFNLSSDAITVLLAFGMIVVVPAIFGVVAVVKAHQYDLANRMNQRGPSSGRT